MTIEDDPQRRAREKNVSDVFSDPVEDVTETEEPIQPDPADFGEHDIHKILEEEEREETQSEPSEDSGEADQEDEPKSRLTDEQRDELNQVKEEIVANLLDDDTLIVMADSGLSRLGSLIPGSTRDNWRMDEEERKIFSKLVRGIVKEEGIQVWSMKTWLFIAFIMFYGFKAIDAFDAFRVKKKLGDTSGDQQVKDIKTQDAEDISILQAQVEGAQVKYDLQKQLEKLQKATNGSEKPTGIPEKDQKEGYYYDALGNPVLNKKGKHMKMPGSAAPKEADKELVEEAQIIEEENDDDDG